jgi:hypothetical protein
LIARGCRAGTRVFQARRTRQRRRVAYARRRHVASLAHRTLTHSRGHTRARSFLTWPSLPPYPRVRLPSTAERRKTIDVRRCAQWRVACAATNSPRTVSLSTVSLLVPRASVRKSDKRDGQRRWLPWERAQERPAALAQPQPRSKLASATFVAQPQPQPQPRPKLAAAPFADAGASRKTLAVRRGARPSGAAGPRRRRRRAGAAAEVGAAMDP